MKKRRGREGVKKRKGKTSERDGKEEKGRKYSQTLP
tara:strand:+ start:489 stop:596 length:108 start_codon:yes stop_codon:yes gene_type:complete